jgi:hypothetical protein
MKSLLKSLETPTEPLVHSEGALWANQQKIAKQVDRLATLAAIDQGATASLLKEDHFNLVSSVVNLSDDPPQPTLLEAAEAYMAFVNNGGGPYTKAGKALVAAIEREKAE